MAEGIVSKIRCAIINSIFPKTCPVCDKVIAHDEYICRKCVPKIHYIGEPKCKKCGKQLSNKEIEYCNDCSKKKHFYNNGLAVFLYDDIISKSIYRFKYHNRRTYAQFYGKAIADNNGSQIKQWGAQVIVPIPIHEKKLIKRGYNQAELIARELGRNIGIKVDEKILVRVINTKPQKEMNKADRKKNLENAFKIATNVVEYKKVILVDDIYTTGSTIDECTLALKAAGVEQVYFVSLSIGAGI